MSSCVSPHLKITAIYVYLKIKDWSIIMTKIVDCVNP